MGWWGAALWVLVFLLALEARNLTVPSLLELTFGDVVPAGHAHEAGLPFHCCLGWKSGWHRTL
jgi:hypothetical protein